MVSGRLRCAQGSAGEDTGEGAAVDAIRQLSGTDGRLYLHQQILPNNRHKDKDSA